MVFEETMPLGHGYASDVAAALTSIRVAAIRSEEHRAETTPRNKASTIEICLDGGERRPRIILIATVALVYRERASTRDMEQCLLAR